MFPKKFREDYCAMFGEPFFLRRGLGRILMMGSVRMILFGRLGEQRGIMGGLCRAVYLFISRRRGIQIDFSDKIGGGLVLAHAYGITVNSSAELGERVMLYKGCTIGGIRNGRRKGTPKIGSRVVVGLNATIVGGVTIGDDVMIAPNAFVNFDVPSHSVVIGSPGLIHHKDNATIDYFPVA